MKKIIKPMILLALVGGLAGCGVIDAIEGKIAPVSYSTFQGRANSINGKLHEKLAENGKFTDKRIFSCEFVQKTKVVYNNDLQADITETINLEVDLDKKIINLSNEAVSKDFFDVSSTTKTKVGFQIDDEGNVVHISDNGGSWIYGIITPYSSIKTTASAVGYTEEEAYRDCFEAILLDLSSSCDFNWLNFLGDVCVTGEEGFIQYYFQGDRDACKYFIGNTTTEIIGYNNEKDFDSFADYGAKGEFTTKLEANWEGCYLEHGYSELHIVGQRYLSSTELEDGFELFVSAETNMKYGKNNAKEFDLSKIPLTEVL